MTTKSEYKYVNPNNLSLEWECLIVSESDMVLDGVPHELISSWIDNEIIQPYSIKGNEINFKTRDVWQALHEQNWYYTQSN